MTRDPSKPTGFPWKRSSGESPAADAAGDSTTELGDDAVADTDIETGDDGVAESADELDGDPVDSDDDAADELEVELETDLDADEFADGDLDAEVAALASAGGDAADGGDDDGVDEDGADPVLAALEAERDQFKDHALRTQAEFENYRKRASAQQAAEVERATGAFAESLLTVLDAAEAAYVSHPDEVGPLFNLLLAELRKRGLEPMDVLDEPFDPTLADAVAHHPGDGGEPRVAEVLRSGYTWHGRTLRPAMVRTTD